MKKTLLTISLLIIILISGFAKNNQTDSITDTKQTVQLKEFNAKVDSLLKITNELSKEKNYFSTALSSQTSIFGIIITIALALFGLISFAAFKIEIKKYKTETKSIINKQDEKIKSIEEKNKAQRYDINHVLATTYTAIAMQFEDSDPYTCFKFSTSAAAYHMKNNCLIPCPSLLNISLRIIESPYYYPEIHNKVVIGYTGIDEEFLELINCEDEAVRNIALKIYSKYIEFKEQVIEASPKA
jgi:hypothetical protein